MFGLDRKALERASLLFAGLMEPGEQVLEFDVGRLDRAPVQCVASTSALYVAIKRVGVTRLAYADMAHVDTTPELLHIVTAMGTDFPFVFKRTKRSLIQTVAERAVRSQP